MRNEHGGSRTDTLVKLVLVFFLSLLSFSVGTFVGKQFSDTQHKQASMGDEDADRSTASIDPDSNKMQPSSALSDEEIAKLENEFLQKDKGVQEAPAPKNKVEPTEDVAANDEGVEILGGKAMPMQHETKQEAKKDDDMIQHKAEKPAAAAPTTATKEQAPAPAKNEAVHEERMKILNQVASGKKPEKNVAPAANKRTPSSLPKNLAGSTVGKFTVQVSSFSSEEEAKSKAAELVGKGLKAFYVPAEIPGRGTWYRVNVGQFGSRQEAMAERSHVADATGMKDTIIQKIQK